MQTVRAIKFGFNKFLLDNAIDKFKISYTEITNELHPTKFTIHDGTPIQKLEDSGILGIKFSDELPASNYLWNELFYDSELEKSNIKENISEVTVFTKIPRNSIKIPVAGGGTYSPDFAYVIKTKDNKKTLNLIVETKDKDARELTLEELQKIKHAEILFNKENKNNDTQNINIKFRAQMSNDTIRHLIKEIIGH